jgi:hypothetical protein
MIHVRHGLEVGRTEGHYDEYGRIIEQEWLPEDKKYRGDGNGPNGHNEICKSEFNLDDSFFRLNQMRVYCGQETNYIGYVRMKAMEITDPIFSGHFADLAEDRRNEITALLEKDREAAEKLARMHIWEMVEFSNEYEKHFAALQRPTREMYSGTAAWHSLCYRQASNTEKSDLTPSHADPDRSWGRIRKKYK